MIAKDQIFPKRLVLLILMDIGLLILLPIITIKLRNLGESGIAALNLNLKNLIQFYCISISAILIIYHIFDLYNNRKDFRQKGTVILILFAGIIGCIATTILSIIFSIIPWDTYTIFIYTILLLLATWFSRLLYSYFISIDTNKRKTIIIGFGESGQKISQIIENDPYCGLKIVGIIERKNVDKHRMNSNLPIFLQEGSLKDEVIKHKPDVMIMAMRRSRYHELIEDLIWCAQNGIEVWDVPTAYERLEKRIPVQYVDELWLLHAALSRPRTLFILIKRIVDIILSILILLVGLPCLIIAGLAMYIEGGRPIIFSQVRIGKNGQLIKIFKMRSMNQITPVSNDTGTKIDDNRITKVGKIIRKLHVDELPQLYNVLSGDLSLIGPRAELYEFILRYLEGSNGKNGVAGKVKEGGVACGINSYLIPYLGQRFVVDQGITGWAQVNNIHVSSRYEDMVEKLEYDLYYIKNMSFLLDFTIVLKTVRIILLGKGK